MHYEGPIYRPPSEANSLLIQVTAGCLHNRCTFCVVYKNGPRYKVRPVSEIKRDLLEAFQNYGPDIRTLFFPAGNTIAVKTEDLCEICRFSRKVFPALERITVYGSSQYIYQKGYEGMKQLANRDEKSFRPFFVGNHFYIHCIITAGALCKSKEKWIDCNYEKRYF